MKNNDVINFLLRLSSFGGEPLYILLNSALDDKVVEKSEEVIKSIYELYKIGYLKCRWNSFDDENYTEVNDLKYEQLKEYIRINEKYGYNDYPEGDGEYFFETTEKGKKTIPEDYFLPGWFD